MSFRLFIYYCALVGGWAAFVGWALGHWLAPGAPVLNAAIHGLFLGLAVALGLGLVDALWNFSPRQVGAVMMRVASAMFVGMFGGFLSALIAAWIYDVTLTYLGRLDFIFVLGWVLVGLTVGVSVSAFDLLTGVLSSNSRSGLGKLWKCALGGFLGGLVGGVLAWVLKFKVGGLFGEEAIDRLWSPTAVGFVALGACIGLLVGLSQVLLKEAWVKVEAGFRPGREMILAKDRVVIGRAEGADIALFGDMTVEKQHAAIVLEKGSYYLEPQPEAASFVNNQPAGGRVLLQTGDVIQVGKSLLRFNERRKRVGQPATA